ncbi:MAG: hypothetical protein ACTSWG_00420 [Candidatus Helarchaeota archaeon]
MAGTFINNCGELKQEEIISSSGHDCGICVKGKYKGSGYTESPIIDWKYSLTVYYNVIKASQNDKHAFRQIYR